MHYFTIRDVENLSGIKAHTLRMWEQRHGLCVCKRKESQHRYYDNEDLKYILRIAYLYHNGYRISRIAALSADEIFHLAAQTFNNDEYEVLVNQLVESGLEYNQLQFEKVLRNGLKTMGLEKTIERVIYPFFNKIGLLWITDHVLPAQEHFCSFLIQKIILSATNALPPVTPNSKFRFLLFTPEGEMHDLPLLLMQYLLKKQGIRTVLLGSNSSLESVRYCCHHQPITHLYFHFITNLTNGDTGAYVNKLAAAFPQLPILASGLALKDVASLPANVQVLRSIQEVIALKIA